MGVIQPEARCAWHSKGMNFSRDCWLAVSPREGRAGLAVCGATGSAVPCEPRLNVQAHGRARVPVSRTTSCTLLFMDDVTVIWLWEELM